MTTERRDTLVMIPTYNERDNAGPMFEALSHCGADFDILFVDDNSPDGTGKILDALAEQHDTVKVLHRQNKMGVGAAHQAGIAWAYERGYRYLLTMDCDFSYSPKESVEFIESRDDYDVIVATRFKTPDGLKDWGPYRTLQSRVAHALTVVLLGMPYDASGALRLYNLKRMRREVFGLVTDKGYSFFWESLFIIMTNGYRIGEIPVSLTQRTYGDSKMRTKDVINGFSHLWHIFWRKLTDKQSFLLDDPTPEGALAASEK